MNVLVTGATGFVGRHLLKHLDENFAANNIGVSRNSSTNSDLMPCELTDYASVEKLIKKTLPSFIFHVAGSYSNDFETDYRCNILSAKNILEAAVKYQPDTRIMLMGSAAEYGQLSNNDNPVTEQQKLNPINIYGWSKAAQSLLAPLYFNQHGLAVMVARTFNLSGTGMSEKLFTGRVEHQIQDVLAGKASRISVGNLDAKRDYIDIESACAMYLTIATRGLPGETYNVGSGIATSMRELLNSMLQTYNLDASIVDEISDNKTMNEVSTIYADVTKINTLRICST